MTSETVIRKIENGRAEFAYKCVKEECKDNTGKDNVKYKSHVKKLPALIRTNGLGAALAFICNKDSEYQKIYKQITRWLNENKYKLIDLSGNTDLVEKIITIDSKLYRAVTVEVIAFVKWLARFVDVLIEGEESE